jgi:hypothetical protein
LVHGLDVLPGEAPGGTSSFERPQDHSDGREGCRAGQAADRIPLPPVQLGVFSVEYLGRRRGLRALLTPLAIESPIWAPVGI